MTIISIKNPTLIETTSTEDPDKFCNTIKIFIKQFYQNMWIDDIFLRSTKKYDDFTAFNINSLNYTWTRYSCSDIRIVGNVKLPQKLVFNRFLELIIEIDSSNHTYIVPENFLDNLEDWKDFHYFDLMEGDFGYE